MLKEENLNKQTLLTIEELAKIFRIATGSIRNQLCRGKFPIKPLKLGHLLRFRAEDVERYLESQGLKGASHE